MMRQYFEVKAGLPPKTLLLFRLGDFYEMFHEDAETGARLLGIALTKRNDYKMAGIPYHAAEQYIGKILKAGMKVALCDQVETPKPGKLVKRSLTRILSPGTTLEENQLESDRNRYLAAVECGSSGMRAAWLDLSTGDFKIAVDARPENLLPALVSLDPAELLVEEGQRERWREQARANPLYEELAVFADARATSDLPADRFDRELGEQAVKETLGVITLDGFGVEEARPALGCAGALLRYAAENLCAKPENLAALSVYRSQASLLVDPATQRNLEIFRSLRGTRQGSLIEAIGRCRTAGGARLLEQWLIAPERDLQELRRRHECVGQLVAQPGPVAELREQLKAARDIARILGRLQNRLRNPRELGAVRETLGKVPHIADTLLSLGQEGTAAALARRLRALPHLLELLGRALKEELPNNLQDGGYIAQGYDEALDRLRALTTDNKVWLSQLETQERQRTGIKNLKVKFNNAFGYFIEVSKSNLGLVPEDYLRKQTVASGERFVTEGLKQKEKEIFHAEENAKRREEELFAGLVEAVLDEADALRETAQALAEIDVLAGWAELAREWDYCRPEIDDGDRLEIEDGRHPVVEQMIRQEAGGLGGSHAFVPNSVAIGASDSQIHLITGPNMAGKSTYIRQVALIVLMAQIGCWVPARSARIGLVDRIFSRVGASDDLARGNSTFMVEMNETANILNNATPQSLVVLDEIGRGTSTYDGLSIAWSVVEHLHRDPAAGPKTLFATHYQELTQLERFLPRLENRSVAVVERDDEIVFVRQVVKGAADRSYGIQVARLAGLPRSVVDRAKEILERLESDDASVTVSAPAPVSRPRRKLRAGGDDRQLDLFGAPRA